MIVGGRAAMEQRMTMEQRMVVKPHKQHPPMDTPLVGLIPPLGCLSFSGYLWFPCVPFFYTSGDQRYHIGRGPVTWLDLPLVDRGSSVYWAGQSLAHSPVFTPYDEINFHGHKGFLREQVSYHTPTFLGLYVYNNTGK